MKECTEYSLKKNNSYMVEFPENLNIKPWMINEVSQPKINNLNTWQNIEIELFDIVEPSTTECVSELIKFCHKKRKKIIFSKKRSKILFKFSINHLDETGYTLSSWDISVKNILKIDFGNLSYSNNEFNKIRIVIQPLDCIFKSECH